VERGRSGKSKTRTSAVESKGSKVVERSKDILKPSKKASEGSRKSIVRSTKTGKGAEGSTGKALGKSMEIVKRPRQAPKAGRKSGEATAKANSARSKKLTQSSKSVIGASITTENLRGKSARSSRNAVNKPEKVSKTNRESVARAAKSRGDKASNSRGKFARESKVNIGTTAGTRSKKGKRLTESGGGSAQRTGKGTRTGRSSERVSKRAGLRSSSRTTANRSSLFTRPANERSLHTRQAKEGRLHTRPANEKSLHVRTTSRKVVSEPRHATTRRQKRAARHYGDRRWKESTSRIRYRERSNVVEHTRRHEHVYVDHHNHIHRTIAWPSYRFSVYYNWGPSWTFGWCYPYYHRRYMFVSLGGYWPYDYGYLRYYRYGCHPYYWYGYYPIAREVQGDTYNYYTYNYYNDDAVGASDTTCDIAAVDHTTFADVREKLAQAPPEPADETLADKYFEDAVAAFEAGDYDLAAELFAQAMGLAPDDMILPFAYCQALFAGGRYTEAAEVLRQALAKISPEKEGVFYPRGLYTEEDILFDQIDQLAEKARLYSFDGDLQLLLGYQLLGVGDLDAALDPLRLANQDLENASPAAVLLSLAEKMRVETAEQAEQEL
jgi:tetratricopeptide (TPR) repeat protein